MKTRAKRPSPMRKTIRSSRLMRSTASRAVEARPGCSQSVQRALTPQETDRLEERDPGARALDRRVDEAHHLARFQPELGDRRLQLDAVAPLAVLDEIDHRVEHFIRALRGKKFFQRFLVIR